ncbi:protein Njmu-R1-like isoform X2 [Anneissia japonica]|uniref:protein Njmu-R1-like isoform X2 n=1 Tax=Anneissia japonica TaxID=1529436 RepID=UPI0014255B45|nr:protein Njmu-R1-like isoform X2 [Anneissia japonica]
MTETESRYFALYTYHTNRSTTGNGGSTVSDEKEKEVSDFLQREARFNSDFSLSVITTNLKAELETTLRGFIATRLSKGTVFSGIGDVTDIDLGDESLQCYYYHLRQANDDHVTDDVSSMYTSEEYVVCFLAAPEESLDLFRVDLDSYSEDLLPMLDSEMKEVNQVQVYLSRWHQESVQYITRCINKLNKQLSILLHEAISNSKLEVESDDSVTKSEIIKFMHCCSLSDLLQQANNRDGGQQDTSSEPSLIDFDESGSKLFEVKSENVVKMCIKGDVITFQNSVQNDFCQEWMHTLLDGPNDKPAYSRQVIESYKLRVIQDMNLLKRLVRQAESDHYALYRAFIFLRKCGNCEVLLKHTNIDCSAMSEDANHVLNILQEFVMQDTSS